MKKYNIQNYIRYKDDVKKTTARIGDKIWSEYTRDELIVKFLPLVENIARKFSTTQQASGVLTINDLIQEGSVGLIHAVNKLDDTRLSESEDIEKTLKSFLSKRIKGAIRRAIDINRGNIKIPEHKLIEIRKTEGDDKKIVRMFFNSVFYSVEQINEQNDNQIFEIPDKSEPYNIVLLNTYLLGLMKTYLNDKEYEVLRMSYGLDCDKIPAKQIAKILNLEGVSNFVRISQIKKNAIDKLIENVNPDQVLDYLE
ncbi:MAG: sigma-70 family RNA polymerase sigma factor [Polaribacter sp.]